MLIKLSRRGALRGRLALWRRPRLEALRALISQLRKLMVILARMSLPCIGQSHCASAPGARAGFALRDRDSLQNDRSQSNLITFSCEK